MTSHLCRTSITIKIIIVYLDVCILLSLTCNSNITSLSSCSSLLFSLCTGLQQNQEAIRLLWANPRQGLVQIFLSVIPPIRWCSMMDMMNNFITTTISTAIIMSFQHYCCYWPQISRNWWKISHYNNSMMKVGLALLKQSFGCLLTFWAVNGLLCSV